MYVFHKTVIDIPHFCLSDWAELPIDVLGSILERVISVSDYSQFSMVCKSWHCIAEDNTPRYHDRLSSVPMLLIPTGKNGIWRLYNVMDDKLLSLQLDISTKRFCGSSKGWLIGFHETQ